MKGVDGYTLPYPDSYYRSLDGPDPVYQINQQIVGIIERSIQAGQPIPWDQVGELKGRAYELGG